MPCRWFLIFGCPNHSSATNSDSLFDLSAAIDGRHTGVCDSGLQQRHAEIAVGLRLIEAP
jgi:hypothetical protein